MKVCGPDAAGWTPKVCGGAELAFEEGYAHGHEWSDDLVFTGSIMGLPAEHWDRDLYTTGLFAYETTVRAPDTDEMQNFMVVSYFME